jgi:hypothetical protein
LISIPFEVFDCNGATCPGICGPIRNELEQAGQAIGATDLLIAARALALVATLMTKKPCPLSADLRPLGDALARRPADQGPDG